MTILETNRLVLRHFTKDDVDNLLHFSDPIAMQFFPNTKSREETQEWIDWQLESYQVHGFGLWAVILRNSDEFAGYCGLIFQEDVDSKDEVEIAYGFVSMFWGCGYATEAAQACYDYATRELGLTRLVSLIDPNNTRSRRVAEKVGMKFEKAINRWDKRIFVFAIQSMK